MSKFDSWFDLQEFLRDMRQEQRDDLERLATKVEAGFAAIEARAVKLTADLTAHEIEDLRVANQINARLTSLENMRENAKWFVRVSIGALVALIMDLLFNHVPKFFK